MVEARLAALRKRGVALPPPILVADSWFADSKLMRHVAMTHQGILLVEGNHSPWLQYQVERVNGMVDALETLPNLRQLM
jgi:hypothetical protein